MPARARQIFTVIIAVVATHVAATRASAKQEIIMYGATWCGPCKKVREFFDTNRIRYRYLDVDDEANGRKFDRVTGPKRGIPLVTIGRDRVRGANLKKLTKSLERAGYVLSTAPAKGSEYGGHSARWWESQFRDLRARVRRSKEGLEKLRKQAQYNDEFERVKKLQAQHKMLEQSLQLLEADASDVSLPRRYRAY